MVQECALSSSSRAFDASLWDERSRAVTIRREVTKVAFIPSYA